MSWGAYSKYNRLILCRNSDLTNITVQKSWVIYFQVVRLSSNFLTVLEQVLTVVIYVTDFAQIQYI